MIHHLLQSVFTAEPGDIGPRADLLSAVGGFHDAKTYQGSGSEIGTETPLLQNLFTTVGLLGFRLVTAFDLIYFQQLILRRRCTDRLFSELRVRDQNTFRTLRSRLGPINLRPGSPLH